MRCGVSNFVFFGIGDGSVSVFKVFTFAGVASGSKMMMLVCLLLKIVNFMFLGGSKCVLRLCKGCAGV